MKKKTKDIHETANSLLSKLLEISAVLDILSFSGKSSILSSERIKRIEEDLWQSQQEYKMVIKKYEKITKDWKHQRDSQVSLLDESYENEKKRLAYEYSQVNIVMSIKRTSRKKLSERKDTLKKERDEMIKVIEKEYEVNKKIAQKNIRKSKYELIKNIQLAEQALGELDQLFKFLYSSKPLNEKTYKVALATKEEEFILGGKTE